MAEYFAVVGEGLRLRGGKVAVLSIRKRREGTNGLGSKVGTLVADTFPALFEDAKRLYEQEGSLEAIGKAMQRAAYE